MGPWGTARDWGCVIATDVSVGWGLLDGLWKGAREGESGIDSPSLVFSSPSSHPLNPTQSSFLNKPHITRSEYQLLLSEEHICRHSKAKCGDVCGIWFASNADSQTDAWCAHHTSACSLPCMWLWWGGGGGRHLLTVPSTNFKPSAPGIWRVAWALVYPTGDVGIGHYLVMPWFWRATLCISTLQSCGVALSASWSLCVGFYNISLLAVKYCKRNFQPKLWVLFLDTTMLQSSEILMAGRFVFCSLKQMLKGYFYQAKCFGV